MFEQITKELIYLDKTKQQQKDNNVDAKYIVYIRDKEFDRY